MEASRAHRRKVRGQAGKALGGQGKAWGRVQEAVAWCAHGFFTGVVCICNHSGELALQCCLMTKGKLLAFCGGNDYCVVFHVVLYKQTYCT